MKHQYILKEKEHTMTELERLAVVENEVRNTSTVVNRIETKIDELMGVYVPRAEVEKMIEAVRTEIALVKQQRWAYGALSILAGAALTGLVAYFLNGTLNK